MNRRTWEFTINNYTDDDINACRTCECRYIVWGKEVSPTTGTPHLQGYVEFSACKKTGAACKVLGGRAAVFIPAADKGHPYGKGRDGCRAYCQKDGDWEERGDWDAGGQGNRSDLDRVRTEALDNGMRCITRWAGVQQINLARNFLTYNEPPRDWEPIVYWFWGPTATHKSHLARVLSAGEDVYCKNNGTKWWDGMDGHDVVILDDFRDSWWPITDMLALLDRYEYQVEVKGGWRQIRARKIFVTSAKPPEQCYRGTGEAIQQLLRRIHVIVQFHDTKNRTISKCEIRERSEVGEVILGWRHFPDPAKNLEQLLDNSPAGADPGGSPPCGDLPALSAALPHGAAPPQRGPPHSEEREALRADKMDIDFLLN